VSAPRGGARGRPSPALLCVRVTPRSPRDAVVGWEEDALRVRVTAAPADGAANRAVIDLLARHFDVPKSRIAIVRGETAREKWVRVADLDLAALRERDSARAAAAGKRQSHKEQ
jgi:uncharacterized protein (TIGR00251 family)